MEGNVAEPVLPVSTAGMITLNHRANGISERAASLHILGDDEQVVLARVLEVGGRLEVFARGQPAAQQVRAII